MDLRFAAPRHASMKGCQGTAKALPSRLSDVVIPGTNLIDFE